MTTHITKRALACSLFGVESSWRLMPPLVWLCDRHGATVLNCFGAWNVENKHKLPDDLCDECRIIWDGAHETGEMP